MEQRQVPDTTKVTNYVTQVVKAAGNAVANVWYYTVVLPVTFCFNTLVKVLGFCLEVIDGAICLIIDKVVYVIDSQVGYYFPLHEGVCDTMKRHVPDARVSQTSRPISTFLFYLYHGSIMIGCYVGNAFRVWMGYQNVKVMNFPGEDMNFQGDFPGDKIDKDIHDHPPTDEELNEPGKNANGDIVAPQMDRDEWARGMNYMYPLNGEVVRLSFAETRRFDAKYQQIKRNKLAALVKEKLRNRGCIPDLE